MPYLRAVVCALFVAVTTVHAVPPTILLQPATEVTSSGSVASFTVSASAGAPLSYQWRHFGKPITGAAGPTLKLSNVTMADAGFYDVVVAASGESTVSQAGRLITTPTQYADSFRIDRTFRPIFEAGGARIRAIAVEVGTGRYYVAGNFSTIAGVRRNYLARFNADGAIDPSFVPEIETELTSILIEPDGRILIGGGGIAEGATSRRGIARLHPDGSIDRSFGNNSGTDHAVLYMGRQSGGGILVGGNFSEFNGRLCETPLIRLTANGMRDTSFATPDGLSVANGFFVVDHQDRILVRPPSASGPIMRLLPDGAFDASFAASPSLRSATHIGVLSDDRPVAILQSTKRLVRFNTDGSIDPAFNLALGVTSTSYISAFYVDTEDRIVLGGKLTYVGAPDHPCSYLVRINTDGTIDETFAPGTEQYPVYAVGQLPDGRLLAGGEFSSWGTTATSGIVTLGTGGSLDSATPPGFRAPTYHVSAAIPSSGGKWLVGGGFTHVNGVPVQGLVRLNADGTNDPNFSTPEGLALPERLIRQGDGKILVLEHPSINDYRLRRVNEDGSIDTGFSELGTRSSYLWPAPIALGPDGGIAVGGGGFAGPAVYTSDGAFVRWFDEFVGVSALTVCPDGRLIAGGAMDGSFIDRALFRLLLDGSVDPTFVPPRGSSNSLVQILVEPSGHILLGGNFNSCDSIDANCFARLNADGTVVYGGDFREVAAMNITSMTSQSDGKTILSGWFRPLGSEISSLRRLNVDGTNDASFSTPNLLLNRFSPLSSVQFDDAGRLILTGVMDHQQYGMARLEPGSPQEPSITMSSSSTPVPLGGSAELHVEAAGPDLHYRWFKNGTEIPDSDSSSLRFPAASPDDRAIYNVEIYNGFGSVISRGADLVITDNEYILYVAWAYNQFGSLTEDHIRPDRDPEGDGLTNLEHYAFNTPVGRGNVAGIASRIVSVEGIDFLAIEFPCKADALDLDYHVEASSDLVTWEQVDVVPAGLASPVTIIDSVPISAEFRRFMRVRVEWVTP